MWDKYRIFKGFTSEELSLIQTMVQERVLDKDEFLIREGEKGEKLYLIEEGEVKILKKDHSGQDHSIAVLRTGEVVGEGALFNKNIHAASIQVFQRIKVLAIDVAQLKRRSPAIILKLTGNFTDIFAARLDEMNHSIVASFKSSYFKMQKLGAIRRLTILILALLISSQVLIETASFFTGFLLQLNAQMLIQFPLLLIASILSCYWVHQQGYSLKMHGLTIHHWKKSLTESMLVTIPIMGVIVLAKWILIMTSESFSHSPLFELGSGVKTSFFHREPPVFTRIALMLYILSCPLQEFIFRGTLQTFLQRAFSGRHRIFFSILISSLVFAGIHEPTSWGLPLPTFLMGLIWGWLYSRHRTLIGVVFSHIVLGLWLFYIVNFV